MKPSDDSEKQFYLNSFRHRGILLHVDDARSLAPAKGILAELSANPTMVLTVASSGLGRRALPMRASDARRDGDRTAELAARLLADGRAEVRRPATLKGARAIAFSAALAKRLGIAKIVVVDGRGGIPGREGRLGFVTAASLARMVKEGSGVGTWKAAELEEMVDVVRSGTGSVNMVEAAALAQELFTYEGAGTLLTAQDYCHVDMLGLDDFHEASRLLERGEREGFLLARDERARARLLLCGYGAWFEGGRLAGVVGLETELYRRSKVGEVVGLYTITRFQGEGVGVRLIDHLVAEGRSRGLRALFACTRNPRAAAFFERNGFRQVDPGKVPSLKWRDRPGEERPLAYWRDLSRTSRKSRRI